MIYLIEFEAYDPATDSVVVCRFADEGYTTEPTDNPANVHFQERVKIPGNIDRAIFSNGSTSGPAAVSYGYIELALKGANYLFNYAVDGRRLEIYGLRNRLSAWDSRIRLFSGTMEQIEFTSLVARIRVRDRAAELNVELQKKTYAGTTTTGDQVEAEGAKDLKNVPKPIARGAWRNVQPVVVHRVKEAFQVSSEPVSAITAVRDKGVALSGPTADYASLAALLSATIAPGSFATWLAGGIVRTGATPIGPLTVDGMEGASAADRSTARIVARMLQYAGFVSGVDFLQSDIDALHAANPAEVGAWYEASNNNLLQCISALLDGVGGFIIPDTLGRFRIGRFELSSNMNAFFIDERIILRSQPIERLATNDQGKGVVAWKVDIAWGQNYLVQNNESIDNAATQAVKDFVAESNRIATAKDESILQRNLLASPLEFNSFFVNESDAVAEAQRRLAMYGARRDRYQMKFQTERVASLDIGSEAVIKLDMFDLFNGKPFRIIGRKDNYANGTTVLDFYG